VNEFIALPELATARRQKPWTLELRFDDGLAWKVVTLEVSPRDRQRSIAHFCQLFVYPALSALGWKVNEQP
jgi:hypothetical protein